MWERLDEQRGLNKKVRILQRLKRNDQGGLTRGVARKRATHKGEAP